jgi:TIR domain
MDAFISHSSKNHSLATKVESTLAAAGLDVWLDTSDIHLGALLRNELQASIDRCRIMILLWSRPASQSRWINAEWLTAFHLDKFILPCTLDDTPLPQCLQPTVFLPLRRASKTTLDRLARAVREAPRSRNETPPLMRSQSAELQRAITAIVEGQQAIGDHLNKRQVANAAEVQALLDDVMTHARATWPLDPVIVNLDGYH